VCFGGLFRRQDLGNPQREDAVFGLAPEPVEEVCTAIMRAAAASSKLR
jgi:hypothetical protein